MKSVGCVAILSHKRSLPLWKCGLKYAPSGRSVEPDWSLPLWKCGLKLSSFPIIPSRPPVTSLVEVWIEITIEASEIKKAKSLPLWKCGLKFIKHIVIKALCLSLPLWKCGLKFSILVIFLMTDVVTSLVEVWIEI